MTRTMLAVACAAVALITTAIAQTDVAAARKEFMKTNGKHAYATLNRMVRDQMPYDQAKVDAAWVQFTEAAKKIPSLFPAGSYQGPVADDDYYAAAKMFENQADIQKRAANLGKEIADNQGKIKDLESLKAIWPQVLKNGCDSCHDAYRVKKG